MISGFRAVWDSRRPPGQRVISVHLDAEISESTIDTPTDTSGGATPIKPAVINVDHDPNEEVKREKGGRMYRVVMREYLASGHDGYDMFKGSKYLIEDEGGQMMSTVVRKYLLGESTMELPPPSRLAETDKISYRVTVCEPNVTLCEGKRLQSDLHGSRHRADRPTREETVPAASKLGENKLEARGLTRDQVNQVQEALPG